MLCLSFSVGYSQVLLSNSQPYDEPKNTYSQSSTDNIPDIREFKVLFEESFENGKGSFLCINTKGPLIWHDSRCKFMKISGFIGGTKYEDEAWLLSPSIDLSKVTNHVELTFQHAGKLYGGKNSDLTLWVSHNCEEDNVAQATWEQVKIPVYMNNDQWIFVSSGKISLDNFLGKANVRFAFKYYSSEHACATWQIRNVKVLEYLD